MQPKRHPFSISHDSRDREAKAGLRFLLTASVVLGAYFARHERDGAGRVKRELSPNEGTGNTITYGGHIIIPMR